MDTINGRGQSPRNLILVGFSLLTLAHPPLMFGPPIAPCLSNVREGEFHVFTKPDSLADRGGPTCYNDGGFLACSVAFPFNASNLEKGL